MLAPLGAPAQLGRPVGHAGGVSEAAQGARTEVWTEVWTDGACLGNPGPGGWAWAVPGGRFASGADPRTTNQRMEVTAALRALEALGATEHLEVVSDSSYVVNCFRQRWWEGWRRRGWRNSKGEAVANQDLWRPLVEEVLRRDVRFRWVKGHAGVPMNELVDGLASAAAARGEGCGGERADPALAASLPLAPGRPVRPPRR